MAKNSKHIAGVSLAIMGTGFVATLPFQGPLIVDLLQGGFEAGVVGGLADWFAVTALFRHPLGLPIPHTALLPKNRKRVTTALVSTIENDWLSKESIQDKLKQIRFTEKVLPIIEKELHSEAIKKGIVQLLTHLIKHIQIERLLPFLEKQLKEYLSSIEVRPFLESVANQALDRRYEEKALDVLLLKVEEWLIQENRSNQLGSFALRTINKIEVDGILQFALKSFQSMVNEEKLGSILQNLLLNNITSLRHENDSNRQTILLQIRSMLGNIGDNEPLVDEVQNLLDSLVSGWEPSDGITEVLQKVRGQALAFIQDNKFMDVYLLPFVTKLLNDLKANTERITKIENWIHKQFFILIEDNHSKMGKLVEENLDKLDDETLIEMIENSVGKDLQWIRVNGAVCGFIIGILLTGCKALI
ncbi:DUF445 domain-containing protein [Peribacillus cavernae]|uniref:DUF445 domain-containing protein n=1 Tax=Peribacillus cavernae TaxID=1674310 RepID=A0A433HN74_9BACI|nr:DUF445 domain-containing protein [Peribacillus cavernae]MDQ0221307.1 uncharacterized membrane-anchored protein YjiN (DUF445 family) [Peribacillus cavernae]RUQ29642.1 DUF445 domain-containing protein [Peribacillus cavernae]